MLNTEAVIWVTVKWSGAARSVHPPMWVRPALAWYFSIFVAADASEAAEAALTPKP